MKLDVNRLLEIGYLNELTLQIKNDIDKWKSSMIEVYTLDSLSQIEPVKIKEIFDKYGVSCLNIVEYIESDFIDSDWEFADLFIDDISYSLNLSNQLKSKALDEIEAINSKINLINNENKKKIDKNEVYLEFITLIVKLIITDSVIKSSEIDSLMALLDKLEFTLEEKFNFSYVFTQFLIEKNHELSKKTPDDMTDIFEDELNKIYDEVSYVDENLEDVVETPKYSETVSSYYESYKSLFIKHGLGDTLSEVMDSTFEFGNDIILSSSSISELDFSIKLGATLCGLYNVQCKNQVVQSEMAVFLSELSVLDRIYEEDLKNKDKKTELLNKITDDLTVITVIDVDIKSQFIDRVKNRFSLLKGEIENNMIVLSRMSEIEKEYKTLCLEASKIPLIVRQINELDKLYREIENKLKNYYLIDKKLVNNYCAQLTNIQQKVIKLINLVKNGDASEDFSSSIEELKEEFKNSYLIEQSHSNDKIELKGFVLFDMDENNEPYVCKDLDLSDRNNMIDRGLLQNKIVSGLEDYSSLIKDLLIYGDPKVLADSEQVHYLDRILNRVYYDNDKRYPTGMVRIRPQRNSLVRFISQKVTLYPHTEIHKQVITIIHEVLPNVEISVDEEFSLFINFASALKRIEEDIYGASISRYDKHSVLYHMFIANPERLSLTDEECQILRDIVNMSVGAYSQLEDKNEFIKFDIISQIGGKKSRG